MRHTRWTTLEHLEGLDCWQRVLPAVEDDGLFYKVSIHSALKGVSHGIGQVSFDSTWFGEHRPGEPNKSRHMSRWEWTFAPRGKASHVFVVAIPGEAVTELDSGPEVHSITWLPIPATNQKMMVHCFMTREPVEPLPVSFPGYLFSLALTDPQTSVVVCRYLEALTPEDAAEVKKVQHEARGYARQRGVTLSQAHRMVAGFTNPLGMHGLFEVVPTAA